MKEMKTLTIGGKKYEIVDAKARAVNTRDSLAPIVKTVEGTTIVVDDSSNRPVRNFKLFGKTTQNTTTDINPEHPQELHSVVNPTVTIKGGNLIPINYADGKSKTMNGVTFNVLSDGSVLVNGTATETAYFSFNNTGNKIKMPNGWLSTSSGIGCGPGIPHVQNDIYVDGEYVTSVQTVQESSTRNQFFGTVELGASRIKVSAGDTVVSQRIYPMLCAFENPIDYEPPKQTQTLTINRTLRSIGDICDEIDFERGVFIQRTISRRLLHSDSWAAMEDEGRYWLLEDAFYNVSANAYCTHFSKASSWLSHTLSDGTFIIYRDPSWNDGRMSFKDSRFASLDEWKQFLENNTVEVIYQLATPIETPLTEEEIAVFNTLYTCKSSTTVMNNFDTKMEMEYSRDIRDYIREVVYGDAYDLVDEVVTQDKIQIAVDNWLNAHFTSAEGVSF